MIASIPWGQVLWVTLLASLGSLGIQYAVDGYKDWRRKKRGEL